MRPITDEKFETLLKFIEEKQIDVLMIIDMENSKNINLHYLSGHPDNAIILITKDGETILIPGDIQLAEKHAEVDEIIDLSNFNYNYYLIIKDLVENRWKKSSLMFGVHENIPYGTIIKMKSNISGVKFFEDPIQITRILQELRATKSEYEINQLIKAAQIGNKTIEDIRNFCIKANEASPSDQRPFTFLVNAANSPSGTVG